MLDLACGTGEITRALLSLGHKVTAIDFSEEMLARARAKHGDRARILAGDAERLFDDNETYDALVTRHLVWTLTEPEAAFAEWFRVLRPGGKLLVIDGDWINRSWLQGLLNRAATFLRERAGAAPQAADREAFDSITSRFFFREGLSAERLSGMLRKAGFARVEPADYAQVVKAQQRHAALHDALRLASSTRFALLATKTCAYRRTPVFAVQLHRCPLPLQAPSTYLLVSDRALAARTGTPRTRAAGMLRVAQSRDGVQEGPLDDPPEAPRAECGCVDRCLALFGRPSRRRGL